MKHKVPIRGKMKIAVGNSIYEATLYDNETAETLKALLPLTVQMTELNPNRPDK